MSEWNDCFADFIYNLGNESSNHITFYNVGGCSGQTGETNQRSRKPLWMVLIEMS